MIGSRILKSAQEPLRAMIGDRLSLVGVVVLLSIICMALFAPFLSTHEPLAVNEREEAPPPIAVRTEGRENLQQVDHVAHVRTPPRPDGGVGQSRGGRRP